MKILFWNEEIVDCTADPHVIEYKNIQEMLEIVLKVCSDPIVHAVESVYLYCGEYKPTEGYAEEFASDRYSTSDVFDKKKIAQGDFAKKHKTEGLYFSYDFEGTSKYHLPPGLSGVKEAIKIIKERIKKNVLPAKLHIDVVWKFAMDSSCSDHIEANFEEMSVDFSNQDWWINNEGYLEHCKKLSEIVGAEIQPAPEVDGF
jgi:hypothetical protein